jgi:HemY protein
LLAQRYDPASVEATWNAIPAADRTLPEVALEGARLFNLAGRGGRAAEVIEQALKLPPAEWDDTCMRLLDEYAQAQSFPARSQLERVEHWLAESPRDDPTRAALLRTAGLLCLREQLWGKAKSYLTDSLQIEKYPATLVALARLAEAVGDDAEAAQYYREAALGFAQPVPMASDSARPGLREHTV